jgi:uncharacterized protein (TIGR02145 family)
VKKAAIVIVLMLGCLVSSTAQKPSLELTFTAIDSAAHIQLDSIKVMNRTQGGDTVLYYPDTVLMLNYVLGIEEMNINLGRLRVFQNYPNPVVARTTISVYIPNRGLVSCLITDVLGRMVCQYEKVFESGMHSLSYTPGGGEMSFFTALYENSRETIKIIHINPSRTATPQLSYIGESNSPTPLQNLLKESQEFNFNLGDELVYVGFANGIESGLVHIPSEDETFYLQFAKNIPCPGIPTVTYEGQTYNTVLIYNQCWLKENLDVGIKINADVEMTDNEITEKYCYNDDYNNCITYGGLYQWDEMMQYTTIEASQGICPDGWHLPDNNDWYELRFNLGGDSVAGGKLKEAGLTHWEAPNTGATNESGFTALPGGYYVTGYAHLNETGLFWSSTEYSPTPTTTYRLWVGNGFAQSGFSFGLKTYRFSVRCIKNSLITTN